MLALNALRRAFDYRGRSSRAEYWQFVGCSLAAGVATMTFDAAVFGWYGKPILTMLLVIVLLVPWYTVTMRRLHDRGISAWLIAIIWAANFGLGFATSFHAYVQYTALGWISGALRYVAAGLLLGGAAYLLFEVSQAGDRGDNRFGPPPSDELLQGGLNFGQAGDLAKDVIAKVGGSDPLTQIERLAKLRDQGVLTEIEFDAQKAALLKRL